MMMLGRRKGSSSDGDAGSRVLQVLHAQYGWTPDRDWTRRVEHLADAHAGLRSRHSIALLALAEYVESLDPAKTGDVATVERFIAGAVAAYRDRAVRRAFAGEALMRPAERRFGIDCTALRQAMARTGGEPTTQPAIPAVAPHAPAQTTPDAASVRRTTRASDDARFGPDFIALVDRIAARLARQADAPSPLGDGSVISAVEMQAYGPLVISAIVSVIAIELASVPDAPPVVEHVFGDPWSMHCAEVLGADAMAIIRRHARRAALPRAAND